MEEVLLAQSPAASVPDPTHLDFALIRLANSPGQERGWEKIGDAQTPAPAAVQVVFQHPLGQPLQFAAGLVARVGNVALPHRATTQKGSSGSPVFDFSDLRLTALHHYGTLMENQAVLLRAIFPHIQP